MPEIKLTVSIELYRLLQHSARSSGVSLEEECLQRLEGGARRSRYVQALITELQAEAEEAKHRAISGRNQP